jgi:hypothetical protein
MNRTRGQYSLKTMFGLVAACGFSLALTRVHFLIGAAVMIACVVVVAILGKDASRQRALIYGAVSGAALFLGIALAVARARGELPVPSYTTPDTTISFARQYAIPIGGFLGAVAGSLYADRRRRRELIGDEAHGKGRPPA